MPNRIIRDGCLDSARVDALSLGAEVFYKRLFNVVDDYGRFEADPIVLLARAYPRRVHKYSVDDIEGWLEECVCGPEPLVTVYQIGRKRYLQVNNFNQRERTPSKFPAPPNVIDEILSEKSNGGTLSDIRQTNAGLTRASNTHTDTNTDTTCSETETVSEQEQVREVSRLSVVLPIQNRSYKPSNIVDSGLAEFLEAANSVGMIFGETELTDSLIFVFRKVDIPTRMLAVKGIHDRRENGEYADPARVPTMARYLRERLWERKLRPKPKAAEYERQTRPQTNGALAYDPFPEV